MTYKTSENQATEKKKKRPFFVVPVNSCLSAILCVGMLVSTGMVSFYREEAKQDRTVTVEQILARRKEVAERIKNDPNMPPQAKAMALSQLQQPRQSGQEPPAPQP